MNYMKKLVDLEKEIKEELNQQAKEYELKLKQQKIAFDEELKIKNRLIEEMMTSTSWKITKPLRNVRIFY